MRAWSGDERGDIMGAVIAKGGSNKDNSPPLKNGSDLRESGYLIAVGSRTARFRRKHRNKCLTIALLMLILLLLSLAIAMTVLYMKLKKHKPMKICESRECLRSAANLAISMDMTVDPCEDFYTYVCGNWPAEHPRPDAYRSYDWFREKQTKVYSMVRDFLTKNITDHPRPVQQARDVYTACMDVESLNKLGVKPIIKILESLGLPSFPTYVNSTEDTDYDNYNFDWLEAVIRIKIQLGMDILIGFDIFNDPKNSSVYRLIMGSPETTNPFPSLHNERKRHIGRRSFSKFRSISPTKFKHEHFRYSKNNDDNEDDIEEDEEKSERLYRIYYAEVMKIIFLESGGPKTTKLSEAELDANILEASKEYLELYNTFYEIESTNDTIDDEEAYINLPEYTVDELQEYTDIIVESNNATATPIWRKYLERIFNISDVSLDFDKDKIFVTDLDLKYMSLMASLLASYPPVAVELYVWMQVIKVLVVHTTSELRALHQRYYDELHGRSGSGVPARSLQCAGATNDLLGMAVAYAIADKKFFEITKPRVQIMLNEMKDVLRSLVGKTKWMDYNTKIATFEKIDGMKSLIGFPNWLLEEGKLDEYYDGVETDISAHLDNMISIIQVKIKKALNKFRESNNFTWATDPTEVNAFHTFQENTINISNNKLTITLLDAAIPLVMLQYPFYDLGIESLNYGSLGTILGHEITHGFDNFGRLFDKNGNLLPWWSDETVNSFVNMTKCFIEQYSSYYIEELHEYIDGKKTLGENIADNGGVREALGALKQHLRKYGPEQKLPGFETMSSEQMFFLSYGNLWCGVSTDDSLKSELDDVHSPQSFRARGALQNNAEFTKAWKCRTGSSMNPPKRCIIF